MRHNNVRDFEANLLKAMHNDIEIEPALQEITNEEIPGNGVQTVSRQTFPRRTHP